jgi:hypothetical protein
MCDIIKVKNYESRTENQELFKKFVDFHSKTRIKGINPLKNP